MPGKVIGINMMNGYAGTVARTADSIIQNRTAKVNLAFGVPVVLTTDNKYDATGATTTAANVAGITVREVVQANTYDPQSNSDYLAGKPCDVLVRGQITVKCQRGTPTAGGTVYLRTKANTAYASAVVGGLEASDDTGNVVALTNMEWTTGEMDSNNIAELTIKTRNRG